MRFPRATALAAALRTLALAAFALVVGVVALPADAQTEATCGPTHGSQSSDQPLPHCSCADLSRLQDLLQSAESGADGAAADVYRRTLEALLEKAVLEVSYKLVDTNPQSGFDAEFKASLRATASAAADGRVVWLGKGSMTFTNIQHMAGNRYRGCEAADAGRDDVLRAVTEDFRTLQFAHRPGAAVAHFKCNYNATFDEELPALLAAEWQQYLLADTHFELSSFGGLRGMGFGRAPRAATPPPGFRPLPGFGASQSAVLPPAILGMLTQATQTNIAPRTSFPWPPAIARGGGGAPQAGDERPELYVDDASATTQAEITTRVVLNCPR
jgi:hypothetical protein